jgi:hypothetical protein
MAGFVLAGLVPALHANPQRDARSRMVEHPDVDGRLKAGHDARDRKEFNNA